MRTITTDILLTLIISLIVSISVGLVMFGVLGIAPNVGFTMIAIALAVIILISVGATLVFYMAFRAYASERAVKVAMMTLSDEERKVLQKVMELGGEIRQDDLWRKLRNDFSRSKLSQLVINLEKKNALTRKRHGRTNILKLTAEFSKR
ncbi:MAG: helix-turn-helix transcriptional regulator [Candidatus Hadarchaeales archaeon]